MTETIHRICMCLPDFMSDSSGRMPCPPKNIAKGPLVIQGRPPVKIWTRKISKFSFSVHFFQTITFSYTFRKQWLKMAIFAEIRIFSSDISQIHLWLLTVVCESSTWIIQNETNFNISNTLNKWYYLSTLDVKWGKLGEKQRHWGQPCRGWWRLGTAVWRGTPAQRGSIHTKRKQGMRRTL